MQGGTPPATPSKKEQIMGSYTAFVCYTLAMCSNQIGFTLMKLAHKEMEQHVAEGKQKTCWAVVCRAKWLLGFVALKCGSVLQVMALPFADLILLSNACSISVVMSTLLAIKFLNEKFIWQYDLSAILLICLGSMLTVVQSNKEEIVIDTQVALDLLISWRTGIYFLWVAIFVSTTLCVYRSYLATVNQFYGEVKVWHKDK